MANVVRFPLEKRIAVVQEKKEEPEGRLILLPERPVAPVDVEPPKSA